MNTDTPIIFADGTEFYNELRNTYTKHDRGLFILAPSGAGKTYFVERQTERHWIDGDFLWPRTNADLTDDDWVHDQVTVEWINKKCDIITNQAKMLGFWIIGSSSSFLQPDAIVIPEWEVHKSYIENRQTSHYDGGAKSSDLHGVLKHRKIIEKWKTQGVPCFKSVEEAAAAVSLYIESSR